MWEKPSSTVRFSAALSSETESAGALSPGDSLARKPPASAKGSSDMKVLLIGSGGREHALAWKLAQSPLLTKLWAAPGNPGIAEHAELVALDVTDHEAVLAFCGDEGIELVVIGPEAPLVDGLGDTLRAAGILVFGPNRIPAQLEGSKGFTKDLCAKHNIPTAAYGCTTNRAGAESILEYFGLPVVIKADGLAAGKGVIIAETAAEAAAGL